MINGTNVELDSGSDYIYLTSFNDDNAYGALVENGYVPILAQRRQFSLGGQPEYEDVQESVRFDFYGGESPLPLINRLMAMFVQARRWAAGENVSPVIINVSPQGSTIFWRAAILDATLDLPADWVDKLLQKSVDVITIHIRRHGQWMSNAAPTTLTINNVRPNTIASASLANAGPLSSFKLTGMYPDQGIVMPGFLVISGVDKIKMQAAKDCTVTNGSTVAASSSMNGNIRRMTSGSGIINFQIPAMDARRVHLFASIWAPAGTQIAIDRYASGAYNRTTFYANSDSSAVIGKITYIGELEWQPNVLNELRLLNNTAQYDIDYLCAVAADDSSIKIIDAQSLLQNDLGLALGSTLPIELRIENNPLATIAPRCYFRNDSYERNIDVPVLGDTWLSHGGSVFYFLQMAQGYNISTWCPRTPGSAIQTYTLNLSKLTGSLIPT